MTHRRGFYKGPIVRLRGETAMVITQPKDPFTVFVQFDNPLLKKNPTVVGTDLKNMLGFGTHRFDRDDFELEPIEKEFIPYCDCHSKDKYLDCEEEVRQKNIYKKVLTEYLDKLTRCKLMRVE
jgi:hypothetical protein